MRRTAIACAAFLALSAGAVAAMDFPGADLKAVPRAVKVARTTAVPDCKLFVDAAAAAGGTGTAAKPLKTIASAVKKAKAGDVICVAEGTYAEQIRPETKPFTLAGGFQSGKKFKVRDSAKYVSKAKGDGTGSFIRIEDPGPTGNKPTVIDGFDISGYSQAIFRDYYVSQRFDITNNNIHDNRCSDPGMVGAGFALVNVSGTIRGNVLLRNVCDRGGAGFINDTLDENNVSIRNNRIVSNEGIEPSSAHGGALYLFNNRLTIVGNEFVNNRVTGWGAGLYLGAYTTGGQHTSGKMSWNVYRGNRAGIFGGGFFCDDSAHCTSDHELFVGNCGGNVYYDSASGGRSATIGRMDHMTNVGALSSDCKSPGAGVQIDRDNTAPDTYTFTNSLFWGNGKNLDLVASCITGCKTVKITVSYSMIQKKYTNFGGVKVKFGDGIVKPTDPRFVSLKKGDFHLKSKFGHWTSGGYVQDGVSSPALAKGDPDSPVKAQPPRAGNITELGVFGNSSQASYVR